MAAQNSFTLAEEELSCPICFEEFCVDDVKRHPKLLLCLHTFCSGCIETLRKYDGTLLCSICRTLHMVHRVKDLMENYVIFEHLRLKQEADDESLAMQLRDEYDVALKRLQEQEEKDAVLAMEEEEKMRIEIERLEREKREEEESERRRREERVRQEEEARKRLEEEQQRIILEENERKQNEGEDDNRIISDVEDVSDDIYSFTNTSDTDGESSEDSNESSDNDEESPFHDVDETATEEEAIVHIRSFSSLNSEDDYVTIGNDSDHHSSGTISLSSDNEEEMGTAVSGTVPVSNENTFNLDEYSSSSASPEPDFLSEEFSGVAKSTGDKRPNVESLSELLPSVHCCERADGSIVVLDDHKIQSLSSDPTNSKSSQQIEQPVGSRILNTKHRSMSSSVDCTDTVGSSDENEWIDIDTSEDEALSYTLPHNYRPLKKLPRSCNPLIATKASTYEDENCDIQ